MKTNKYIKTGILRKPNGKPVVVCIDSYDIDRLFPLESGALIHARKKLMIPGERGHKDYKTDLQDMIASIQRELDTVLMVEEYNDQTVS